MKYAISIYLLTLFACTYTPVMFNDDENVVHIIEDLNGSQDELFLRANNWMIKTFNNAESVIQHSDKEDGVILGKYLMYGMLSSGMYGSVNDTRVYSIIDIRVKDHKARIEIKPQGKWNYDPSGMTIYQYSKQSAIKDMNELVESFKKSMNVANVEF